MVPKGVALVTGASRGIGRAVALDLARTGFDVVAAMRDPSAGTGLVDELGEADGTISVAALDVTKPETIDIPPGLRVVVNNAGIEAEYLPVEHLPMDRWRAIFETNVFGLVEVTRRAIPVLRENGGGVICNVTSSSILIGTPFYAAYRASKAAVAALGESLQIEVGAFGIRVVEIMPGPVATDMLAESDRLPEGAQHPGYEDLAALMYEGRKGIEPMVTPAEEAAVAIREAILDDRAPLKHGCDPLGRQILDAWRANPVAPSF